MMATARKTVKSKTISVAKKNATKPEIEKTEVNQNTAKPVIRKKTLISMKKTTARPVVSIAKELRASIATLKREVQDLKTELKNTRKRADALAELSGKRDAAMGRFLQDWDKKTFLALENSLKPGKRKKSKKEKITKMHN
jgi:hypothetical protein